MQANLSERPTAIYVGVGVGTYLHQPNKPLPKAVSEVTDVGAELEAYGYRVHVLEDPTEDQTRSAFKVKLPKDVMRRGGSLILLWAGHGEPTPEQALRLIARDTEPGGAPEFTATYLASVAARTGAGQILLILDTCFSGKAVLPAADVADRVLRELPSESPQVWVGVVASALDFERARDGAFGEQLLRLLRNGPADPVLKLRWSSHSAGVRGDDLIDALLKEWDVPGQRPKHASTGDAWVMFPNPRFVRDTRERVVEHLVLAARGVEPGEEGFYFTGRVKQLEQIVSWIHTGRPDVFVVTGPPGSGKSAIVGRVVSLSNPQERARLLEHGTLEHRDPGEGYVHAHVHARAITAERLVELIDEQLVQRGVLEPSDTAQARNRGDLLGAILRSGKKPVIALDGLDEAGSEAWRIAEEVIRLLSSVSLVLVSTRDLPPRVERGRQELEGSPGRPETQAADLGGLSLVQTLAAKQIVDLSDKDKDVMHQTQADVRRYVAKRLDGIGPPEMDAVKVGDAIVRLAREDRDEGLFLLARVVTAQLRSAPLDTSAAGWERSLDRSIEDAFDRDLSRVPPLRQDDQDMPHAARELLTALAWGYGAGLPDDLWPIVATALSPTSTTYRRGDVFWLLGEADRYVIESGEGGRAVYRLAHQRLSAHLRPPPRSVAELEASERRAAALARALVDRYLQILAAGGSPRAPAYLWSYAWRHCADGGNIGVGALRELVQADAAAFLPDLASALNNLGVRYSAVGRRQEAVAPTEEAVATYRELAATNPAFLPDLARALNNLGNRYGEVGRGEEVDRAWQAVGSSFPSPSHRAFLLARRAAARSSGDLDAVEDLWQAWSLVPGGEEELAADLRAVARVRRAENQTGFDAAWRRLSGAGPPDWLLLP